MRTPLGHLAARHLGHHLARDGAQRQALGRTGRVAGARQVQQVVDQVAHAVGCLVKLADLRRDRAVAARREVLLEQAEVSLDRDQRALEVVRDGVGKPLQLGVAQLEVANQAFALRLQPPPPREAFLELRIERRHLRGAAALNQEQAAEQADQPQAAGEDQPGVPASVPGKQFRRRTQAERPVASSDVPIKAPREPGGPVFLAPFAGQRSQEGVALRLGAVHERNREALPRQINEGRP